MAQVSQEERLKKVGPSAVKVVMPHIVLPARGPGREEYRRKLRLERIQTRAEARRRSGKKKK